MAGREHARRDVRRADGRGLHRKRSASSRRIGRRLLRAAGRAGRCSAAAPGLRCERDGTTSRVEIVASRLEVLGPVTERRARWIEPRRIARAARARKSQGRILRGRFTPGSSPRLEWCDRRLLARIHRYTLNRLRAEIEPVTAADFMRFLLHWQHVAGEDQVKGAEGLAAVVEQLEGFELAAAAWEHDVLPARVADYGAEQIDRLCLSGRVAWGRLTPWRRQGAAAHARRSRSCCASTLALWRAPRRDRRRSLSSEAAAVREALRSAARLSSTSWWPRPGCCRRFVERGAGRARRRRPGDRRQLRRPARAACAPAGASAERALGRRRDRGPLVAALARSSGRRRRERSRARCSSATAWCSARCSQRESPLPPWRELVRVYRRLEARGEIRGGRFVAGFGGEQFAGADAVGRLRAVRKMEDRRAGSAERRRSAQPGRHPHARSPRRSITGTGCCCRTACRSRRSKAASCAVLAESDLRRRLLRPCWRGVRCAYPLKPHLRCADRARDPALARVVH